MKLLMHACCGPCSIYPIEILRKEGIEPDIYWFNPNIHPYKEYENRLNALKELSNIMNFNLIIEDNYGLDEFCKNVSNRIESRCIEYCYPVRLKRLFEYAKENGYDAVSTTLLYSIYQKHDFIKMYCEKLSKEYGIEFLYRDFRVGFYIGKEKAKEYGIYIQKYCGCIFSEEDRYVKKTKDPLSIPESGFIE